MEALEAFRHSDSFESYLFNLGISSSTLPYAWRTVNREVVDVFLKGKVTIFDFLFAYPASESQKTSLLTAVGYPVSCEFWDSPFRRRRRHGWVGGPQTNILQGQTVEVGLVVQRWPWPEREDPDTCAVTKSDPWAVECWRLRVEAIAPLQVIEETWIFLRDEEYDAEDEDV